MKQKIAVLLPYYNEEETLAAVINNFRKELSEANVFVYDNNSSDNSVKIAVKNREIVRHETIQGKGNVIRAMFRDIEADIFVMADADNTHPADNVHKLIKLLNDKNADMVIGDRLSQGQYLTENKRRFNHFGNNLVCWLINKLFKEKLNDIMTGYRVFNRKFVKNMPVMSSGFEIETEMTLHALDKRVKIIEIPVNYRDRPKGSISKLNTFSDGFKIIKTVFSLFKDYKPLTFFSLLSLLLFMLSIGFSMSVFIEFIKAELVTIIPKII